MPSKYIPVKEIAVELWVGESKVFRHMVDENQIVEKCAQFKEMATEHDYFSWAIYVVRPVYRKGGLNGFDKKISREQLEKWKNKFKY